MKHDRTHPVDRHCDTADDDHAGSHPRLLRTAARHRPAHPATDPRDLRRRRDRAPSHGAPRTRRGGRRRHLRRRSRSAALPRHRAAQCGVHPPRARAVAAGRAGGPRPGGGGGIRDHPRRDRLVHRMLRSRPRFPHRPRPRSGRFHRAVPPRIHRLRGRVPRAARGGAVLRGAARRRRAGRVHRAVQPAHPPEQLARPDRVVVRLRRRLGRRRRDGRHRGSSADSISSASARRSRARASRTWPGRSATTASRWCSPPRCRASSGARSAVR